MLIGAKMLFFLNNIIGIAYSYQLIFSLCDIAVTLTRIKKVLFHMILYSSYGTKMLGTILAPSLFLFAIWFDFFHLA